MKAQVTDSFTPEEWEALKNEAGKSLVEYDKGVYNNVFLAKHLAATAPTAPDGDERKVVLTTAELENARTLLSEIWTRVEQKSVFSLCI